MSHPARYRAPNEMYVPALISIGPGAAVSQKPAGPDAPTAATFAAVVEQHWDKVYRLLNSLTGNVHDTEDLTQETFLRALDKLAGFKPGTNLRSCLLRIGSNAFLDQQRKRK